MSIRVAVTLIAVAAGLAACTGDDPSPESAPVSTPSTSAPIPAPTPPPAAEQPTTVADRPASPCERTGTEVIGRVATADLTEASGLAASRVHPGVLWSHNDGGSQPGVFAIGPDGSDLGFHSLPVDAVDIEDMAIAGTDVNGGGGGVLYLADIGDNGEQRPSISVFRFAEPDPAVPGPIESVERFDFTYPDRPHNAETLLVDERNGRIVVVTKEQAARDDGRPDPLGSTEMSFVFEGILGAPSPDGAPTTLTEVGIVDTLRLEELASNSNLHPSTIFGFGGVITGGDVSADGSFVALRTYEAVWVWSRGDEQSVAESVSREVFADEPCQVVSISELQGEAIAFVGDELVTLGEGVQQPINRLGR